MSIFLDEPAGAMTSWAEAEKKGWSWHSSIVSKEKNRVW